MKAINTGAEPVTLSAMEQHIEKELRIFVLLLTVSKKRQKCLFKTASFRRRKLAAEITFMCYNMDAKNNTGSAVLAVEPCSFIHRSNRLDSALQFFPYTGRRKALTNLSETEKHIEVIRMHA